MGAVYFNSCLLFLSISYVRKTTEWTRHSLCFLLPLGILKCPELTISTWATAGIWASPVAEDSSIVCYVLVWEHWHTIWLRRKTGSVRVELLMVLKSRIKPKSGHCSRPCSSPWCLIPCNQSCFTPWLWDGRYRLTQCVKQSMQSAFYQQCLKSIILTWAMPYYLVWDKWWRGKASEQ